LKYRGPLARAVNADRERHWQSEWARAGLAHARFDPAREKYYALVAYPGSSGFLHVGHLRGLSYADFLHRFHRMNGRSVFFPTGTHMSGLPAVTFAQKVRERDPTTVRQLEQHGVPQSAWRSLEDPETAGRFLGQSYLEAYRAFGLLIDERAYVTTIDEDYQAFIRWQFHRLDAMGALVQAPHFASVCPVCGPVSVDPSETDLSRGGSAEWVQYHTVPFALPDGRLLLAATLRPETLFGATNVWLAPSGVLSTWHLGPHRFLVTPAGGRRLLEQGGGHLGAEVPVQELLGTSVTVPITGARIPVLASRLVDPDVGTGVVMSVPAHAPADWIAVQALPEHDRRRLPAIEAIIDVDTATLSAAERTLLAGDGPPAARAARAAGAQGLDDAAAILDATQRLYRVELLRGRMRAGILDGRSVAEARVVVAERLLATGTGLELREFSEPVVCRNGHEVIIRRVPEQWFIRYSDPAWKAKCHELLGRLDARPEEYARELPEVIDWFADRPCTRRGRWLGTPFPKDESWIIEPIADSTFYPAYFPIRRHVADGALSVDALTDAFFDYVFLGLGAGEPSVPAALQASIREEFRYWYPLDLNIAGKEHKRVHFPVFLAVHALFLPPALQPKGLFVHGWLTGPGGSKISKKEIGAKAGLIPPLREAFERWGADTLRLVYATASSPAQDVAWDPALADRAAERLEDLARIASGALAGGAGGPPELERWLASRAHELLRELTAAFAAGRFRDAAEAVYAGFPQAIRRYLARGGVPGPALSEVVRAWIGTMGPITPHLAEELGAGRFPGLVAEGPFPGPEAFALSPEALEAEALIERVEEDLRSVIRPAAAKGSVLDEAVLFVAAPWKRSVERWMRELPRRSGQGPEVGAIMERAKAHPQLQAFRAEIPRYVTRVAPLLSGEPDRPLAGEHDLSTLRAAAGYLARRFEFRSIAVVPEEEGEPHDPKGRRERARPGVPAFYLFSGKPAPGAGGAPREGGR
jgi:leucyl-tRNA synthetase